MGTRTKALMLRWSIKEGASNSTCSEEAHEIYALAEELEDALRELVACKDLKDRIDEITAATKTNIIYNSDYQEWLTMSTEYRRRKPLAWTAARRILST